MQSCLQGTPKMLWHSPVGRYCLIFGCVHPQLAPRCDSMGSPTPGANTDHTRLVTPHSAPRERPRPRPDQDPDVELQDEAGRLLGRAKLPEGVSGIARLHAMIGEHLGEGVDEADV